MRKNIGKNISKHLSSKYSLKLLDHAKQFTTDAFKTASKKQFKKQQKQLVILITDKITKALIASLQNSSAIKNIAFDRNTKRKIHISTKKKENY